MFPTQVNWVTRLKRCVFFRHRDSWMLSWMVHVSGAHSTSGGHCVRDNNILLLISLHPRTVSTQYSFQYSKFEITDFTNSFEQEYPCRTICNVYYPHLRSTEPVGKIYVRTRRMWQRIIPISFSPAHTDSRHHALHHAMPHMHMCSHCYSALSSSKQAHTVCITQHINA